MKALILPLVAAGAILSGQASAGAVAPEVNFCLNEVNNAMTRTSIYDAFIPTQFLDTVNVLQGEMPYGDGDPTMVSAMVMVEGYARKISNPDVKTEVTVKCGLTGGVVKVINILPGHNLKVTRPT